MTTATSSHHFSFAKMPVLGNATLRTAHAIATAQKQPIGVRSCVMRNYGCFATTPMLAMVAPLVIDGTAQT